MPRLYLKVDFDTNAVLEKINSIEEKARELRSEILNLETIISTVNDAEKNESIQ